MGCHVRVSKSGYLGLDLWWRGERSWEGLRLPDTPVYRKVAEQFARQVNAAIEAGAFHYEEWFPHGTRIRRRHQPSVPGRISGSVRALYEAWISRQRPPLVRHKARLNYASNFQRHILPALGHKKLTEITPDDIRDLQLALADKGLAANTINNIVHATLRALCRDYRCLSCFEGVRKLTRDEGAIDPFTKAERDKLLEACKRRHPRYYPFLATLFLTGLRPSEALGLKWGSVDFTRKVLFVRVSRVGRYESSPKTRGSRREVLISSELASVLRAAMPLNADGKSYVFTGAAGRPITLDSFRERVWQPLLRRTGIRPRKLYATRHTRISLDLSRGVNVQWLSEQTGTSLAMMSSHYGRYMAPGREGEFVNMSVNMVDNLS